MHVKNNLYNFIHLRQCAERILPFLKERMKNVFYRHFRKRKESPCKVLLQNQVWRKG